MIAYETELADFISYLTHQKQYSLHTVTGYKRDIERFFNFLNDQEVVGDWGLVDTVIAKSYLSLLSRSDLAPPSILRSISALRQFWQFCKERDVLVYSPWEGLVIPKLKKTLPTVLYPAEMIEFLSSISTSSFLGKRLLAICELLYATGIRVSELTALKCSDIDFENRQIRILGKGNRERIVFFGEVAEKSLKNYLKDRQISETDMLFVNNRGGSLTDRSVQRFIHDQARLLGYEDHVTPHTFRHSFATGLYDAGVDLRIVQELLGHRSLSTTQIYTHLSKDHLKSAYASAHPRA